MAYKKKINFKFHPTQIESKKKRKILVYDNFSRKTKDFLFM